MKRFLLAAPAALFMILLAGCSKPSASHKVVVLGVDGMEPEIVRDLLAKGLLPNIKSLMARGGYSELGTSVPPESPVAWSNFSTGRNPGGHGIFDFIHRDAATYRAKSSAAEAEPIGWSLPLFGYHIPLTGGALVNPRRGPTFWQVLDDAGVPCLVYRMPANYPPAETGATTYTGMNTPDVRGGYGVYSYYTNALLENTATVTGDVHYISIGADNVVRTEINGPPNILDDPEAPPTTKARLRIYLDPEHKVAKITTDTEEAIIKEGEWSPFLAVDFELLPYLQSVSGIVRFYLKEISPDFKLYASPVNFNPEVTGAMLSTPEDACVDLAGAIGRYYTQGMAEETKALQEGILTDAEFMSQVRLVMDERHRMLEHALSRFESGLLFFYYSSSDLVTHMMWRYRDPQHPAYDPALADRFDTSTELIYEEIDGVVGRIQETLGPEDVLIVMSDHGFATFRRTFNLNTWLVENGYMTLRPAGDVTTVDRITSDDPPQAESDQAPKHESVLPHIDKNVDWAHTRAYGIGFNALYINQAGREARGIVDKSDKDALIDEISAKLVAVIDPATGDRAILRNYKTSEVYSGEAMAGSPDLVLGFKRGYGASDQSALGDIEPKVFRDNTSRWSGNHLMAAEEVPGVLFSSVPIKLGDPSLVDLTVGVLQLFGVEKDPSMVGRKVF